MIRDCLASGLPEPGFESRSDTFRVVFRKSVPIEERFASFGFNPRQLKAISHVVQHGRISRQEYQRLTSTKPTTAKRDLSELVDKGVLAKKGVTKSAWYELATTGIGPNGPKMG